MDQKKGRAVSNVNLNRKKEDIYLIYVRTKYAVYVSLLSRVQNFIVPPEGIFLLSFIIR